MRILPVVLVGLVLLAVLVGIGYLLVLAWRSAREDRPTYQTVLARRAGREDVLNGWMNWATHQDPGHVRTVSWDVTPKHRKLQILDAAGRHRGKFDAAASLVSDEWRVHSNPRIRAAYLGGAQEAGEEIRNMALGVYRASEESDRQGRRITEEIAAVRELDPAAEFRRDWDEEFHG